jgi:2-(1,2-epoxy-1,2-dihydrophenyl)acetyl-CoA isomerase
VPASSIFATMTPTVLVEPRGAVTVVTLNRPDRRNGVTVRMVRELHAALAAVAAGDARVVVLRGAGDHFCVGADLTGFEPEEGEADLHRTGRNYHSATLLHTMPQVTIAAIDGGCAGAGMGWAAACDLRFASDRARFATGFLKVGASGDMGLAWSLVHAVGSAQARELMYFGDKFDAARALEIGLVTRVIAPERLHDETLALATELAGRHPFPLRMVKANLLSAERMDLAEYVEIETARHLHVVAGPSLADGIRAFRAARDAEGP